MGTATSRTRPSTMKSNQKIFFCKLPRNQSSKATRPRLLRGEHRRRIGWQFLFAGIRALDLQLREQDAGHHDGMRRVSEVIGSREVATESRHVAAHSARIQFVECGASDQLFVPIVD